MSEAERATWLRAALRDHEAPLLRYARRLVGNDDAAKDIVQETFARLCEAKRARVEGHLRPWLFTVCRNLALDTRRKEKRMQTTTEPSAELAAGPQSSPSRQLEARRTAGRITSALDALPENQREVVRLKFTGGLSYKEIAEVTGLTVSNVGYLMHHGLKAVRRLMAEAEKSTDQTKAAARVAGGVA